MRDSRGTYQRNDFIVFPSLFPNGTPPAHGIEQGWNNAGGSLIPHQTVSYASLGVIKPRSTEDKPIVLTVWY